MSKRRRSTESVLTIAIALAACQATDAPAGSDAAALHWQLSATPLVRIGATGAPDDVLAYVASAIRLGDGRIVIANGMTSEVRFYSDSGVLVTSSGRQGEGPGEYRALWRLCPIGGDSVAVWDVQLRRLTILSPSGDYVRSQTVAAVAGEAPTVRGCTGTDRVLIGPEDRYKFRDLNRVRRDTLPLLALDVRKGATDAIGRYAGEEQYELEVPPVWLIEQTPFGSSTWFAANDTLVVVADNSRDEIRVTDFTGAVKRTFSTGSGNVVVTSEDRARFQDASIDESWRPTYLAARRAFVAEVPFPDHMPYFGPVLLDELDRIWVSRYTPPHLDDELPVQWIVFDIDGDVVATLETPERFRVMQAGDGWLLGVALDDDDVEQVQLLTFDAAG